MMDVLTGLNPDKNYSAGQLQTIIAAWVLSKLFQGKSKISTSDGDVEEEDYEKQSIYSLLYAIYRTVGEVSDGKGQDYEFTFNIPKESALNFSSQQGKLMCETSFELSINLQYLS